MEVTIPPEGDKNKRTNPKGFEVGQVIDGPDLTKEGLESLRLHTPVEVEYLPPGVTEGESLTAEGKFEGWQDILDKILLRTEGRELMILNPHGAKPNKTSPQALKIIITGEPVPSVTDNLPTNMLSEIGSQRTSEPLAPETEPQALQPVEVSGFSRPDAEGWCRGSLSDPANTGGGGAYVELN